MFSPLLSIGRDPALRLSAALLALYGVFAATIAPYQAVIGVSIFGLSHLAYAVLLVVASAMFVAASVTLGVLSDQRLSRRQTAGFSAGAAAAGAGLLWLWPGAATYFIAHALILPWGGAMFGQCFALARLAAEDHPPAARPGIHATIRALFALPFVVVLPLWSVAFGKGAALLTVYPVLTAAGLAMLALVWRSWPDDRNRPQLTRKSGLAFSAALGEFADSALLLRVALVGGTAAATGLYMALIGLTFGDAGRAPGDVALYVGFVAGAEVPFMLALPLVQRLFAPLPLIALGVAIYAVHLTLMPVLAAGPFVWLLILPAALGGAAMLTLPIAYLQDLMSHRPGAGGALMAFQRVAADATVAFAFAVGTALSGYGLAAVIGAAAAVGAALTLLYIDGRR